MLETATLGLLQQEPLHGYRLKQKLELFMGSCISVNYGSIYPLLKRLEDRGLISVLLEEDGEAGSSRKIYSITDAGIQRWKQKMLEHPQESWVNARSRFLIKYFFFNDLEVHERVKLINRRIMMCQLRLEDPEIHEIVANEYQTNVLAYCKSTIQAEIQWLRQQLAVEEERLMNCSYG